MAEKMPSYNVNRICAVYAKLYNETFMDKYGNSYSGDSFHDLVIDVLKALPNGVPYEALRESMSHLAGQVLNDTNVKELCWRLAGNQRLLKANQTVYPWAIQPEPEWVPVQVMRAQPGHQYGKGAEKSKSGAYLRFRVLGGRCCPAEIDKFWSLRMASYLRTELGFSRWNKFKVSNTAGKKQYNLPYYNITELYHLRMMVLIEPELCRPGEPGFKQVKGSGSMQTWNRAIFKLRHRIGFSCPFGFTHECHRCLKGVKSCPAACHEADYVAQDCGRCKQKRAFDLSRSAEICVNCLAVKS